MTQGQGDTRVHSPFGLNKDLYVLLPLSIVIVGLWIPRWSGPLDLRWDGAVYYILGTSIADGKGYRLLHEPGEIEAVLYPPVLPLLAAATQTVLRTNDPVVVGSGLKVFFFIFLASLTIATFGFMRRTPREAFPATRGGAFPAGPRQPGPDLRLALAKHEFAGPVAPGGHRKLPTNGPLSGRSARPQAAKNHVLFSIV